eukprot:CAMPEP_0172787696 /NCGR_PEP_ID=MMETSP1074-20121228/206579_1 /TAXON_ID=2916 /ORGANISM="Ceratium fusus, Strain PA161109" /LENGTH=386 /DNA_ID=CAMNT_0013624717 /DNA_START=34 /DNA_END=1194 /DNA_ORIENTATION=-
MADVTGWPATWPKPETLPIPGKPHRCLEPRSFPQNASASSLPHLAMGKGIWKAKMEEPAKAFASALRARGIPPIACTFCENCHYFEHLTGEKHYKNLLRWLESHPSYDLARNNPQIWQVCLIGGVGGLRFNHLDGSIEVFKGNQVTEKPPPIVCPSPPPWEQVPPACAMPGPPGPPPPPPQPREAAMRQHVGLSDPPEATPSGTSATSTALFSAGDSLNEMCGTDGLLMRSDLQLCSLDEDIEKLRKLALQELTAGRRLSFSLKYQSTEQRDQQQQQQQPPQQQQQKQWPPPPPPPPPPPLPPTSGLPVASQQTREPHQPSESPPTLEPTVLKLTVGEPVLVKWGGSWEPGFIYEASSERLFTVRWETNEITPDVAREDLRPRQQF